MVAERKTKFDPPKIGLEKGFLYPACWWLLEIMSKASVRRLAKQESVVATDVYVLSWFVVAFLLLLTVSRVSCLAVVALLSRHHDHAIVQIDLRIYQLRTGR